MDAAEITQRVDNKAGNFTFRNARMDKDFDRWSLKSKGGDYNILTKENTGVRDTDITIHSNELRTFADEVHSKLASAEMQIAVRMAETGGKDRREEIGKLERLFAFALEKADERLVARLLPPLRDQLIWCSSIRGWVGGRFLIYKDGDDVIFDFASLDPRWLIYETGANGLIWVAYKTFRSSADLKEEYTFEAAEDIINNEVLDYWEFIKPGKVENTVLSGGREAKKTESYDLKSIPILVMPAPTRPPIVGEAGSEIEGYGESIFASIRDVSDMRDIFASIVATHANLMAKQGLINYYTPDGITLKTTVNAPEGILNLPMGKNKLEPTPMRDISPTVVEILTWLNDQVESGALPKTKVGSPPQSGTLEGLIQEARNIVFNPQLRLLSTFYANICRLIEEQLIVGGVGLDKIKKVNVVTESKMKFYETQVTPVDLKKSHIVKVEFTTGTAWSKMDVVQQAQMLQGIGLPEEWIWEYILKIQDPKGLKDMGLIEQAQKSPTLAVKGAVEALVRKERFDDARFLVEDADRMEAQEQAEAEIDTRPV